MFEKDLQTLISKDQPEQMLRKRGRPSKKERPS